MERRMKESQNGEGHSYNQGCTKDNIDVDFKEKGLRMDTIQLINSPET